MAFESESQYRAFLEPFRKFEETLRQLKQVASTEHPKLNEELEEEKLFDRLLLEVIPELGRTIEMPDALKAVQDAVRSAARWRELNPKEPATANVWTSIFIAFQPITQEATRWAATFPAAYAEVYLQDRPKTNRGEE